LVWYPSIIWEPIMQRISATEARNRLSALLDAVEDSGEVVITRRGRPVARLMALAPRHDRERARRAADGLRAASRGLRLGGVALSELIRDDRR
jgi:prevent-host-death family protein